MGCKEDPTPSTPPSFVSQLHKEFLEFLKIYRIFRASFSDAFIQPFTLMIQVVCKKAKERISEVWLQENKASWIFRKTNISYPLIRTIWHLENLTFFVFL